MLILTFFFLLCISMKRIVTYLNMMKLNSKKFQLIVRYYFLMDIIYVKYFE